MGKGHKITHFVSLIFIFFHSTTFTEMLKRIGTSLAKRTSSSQYSSGPQAKHFPIQKSTALPNGSFEGKVAFITGGGTGLGKGMTKKFAELGATVVISSRKQNVLDATA